MRGRPGRPPDPPGQSARQARPQSTGPWGEQPASPMRVGAALPPRHLRAPAAAPGPEHPGYDRRVLSRRAQPIVAIATAPGRGAVGIVRVSGRGLAPLVQALCGRRCRRAQATLLPFLARRRQRHRPGPGAPLSGAALLHRRGRARAAGPRRPGGAAAAAGALPGRPGAAAPSRPAPGRAGRVHRARLPQRQARPGPGRGGGRPDRRQHRGGRALGRPLAGGRVLAASRGACASASCACACWSRPRWTFPRRRSTSCSRPTRAASCATSPPRWPRVLDARAPGRAAARGPAGGAGRPAQRGQELAAQRAGRRRAGHRHADPRHHARPGQPDHPDRRRAAARDRHRRPARAETEDEVERIGIAAQLGGHRRGRRGALPARPDAPRPGRLRGRRGADRRAPAGRRPGCCTCTTRPTLAGRRAAPTAIGAVGAHRRRPGGAAPGAAASRPAGRPAPEGVFIARARHVQALQRTARAPATRRTAWPRERDARARPAGRRTAPGPRRAGRDHRRSSADDLLGEIFGRFCIGK